MLKNQKILPKSYVHLPLPLIYQSFTIFPNIFTSVNQGREKEVVRGDPRPRARLDIAANVPASAEGTGGRGPVAGCCVADGRGEEEIIRHGGEQGTAGEWRCFFLNSLRLFQTTFQPNKGIT